MMTLPLYETTNARLNLPMGSKNAPYPPESAHTASPLGAAVQTVPPVTFDDLLVSVGANRNRDSFIRIFEYFAPRVKSFLMQGGLNAATADELAQETLLTVWDKAESFNPLRAKASTWIFTIARNKKTDYLRKYKQSPINTDDLPLEHKTDAAADDIITLAENSRILTEALAKLPEDQAILLHKSFFEDKTHNAIAAETRIPLGTVKSRIRLALDRLRYHMGVKTP